MQKQLAIKVVVITVIGLVLLIPINMVKSKVYERQVYLEEAKNSVAKSWTDSQFLVTPILVIPYQLTTTTTSGFYSAANAQPRKKLSIIMPTQLNGNINIANKNVYKGIYEVPVYSSKVLLSGLIPMNKVKKRLDVIRGMPDFNQLGTPYLTLHISDMRGVDSTPRLLVNKKDLEILPGSQLSGLEAGMHSDLPNVINISEDISFSFDFTLRGMGEFSFSQLADNADIKINSDWPHPEFTGASLPLNRKISAAGFSANWSSTRFSGSRESLLTLCVVKGKCVALMEAASGVKFIDPVDIYLQSERSIKYAILFVGLSFLTFFIFENVKKRKIHPIQYTFVGLAISIFYLLLISLAEHIAFHLAYGVAALFCLLLLLFYVRYMFGSIYSAVLFSLMMFTLYSLLFVIVQAEDFALLMGAFLVFSVLSVVMVATRKFDWYDLATRD